jgi:hypothetical protein
MAFSKKVMGKEVGDAKVYAKPHNMSGKAISGATPEVPYAMTKTVKDADLKDPVPNGVSYGTSRIKTDGIDMRGYGAATKGIKSRGPMA